MRVGRRRNLARIALDRSGARGTTQWRPVTVVADEEKRLSGVVRIRTWLAHELSVDNHTTLPGWTSRTVTLAANH